MTNKGSEVNQKAAQQRADTYYMVYLALGRERSLSKLHETLTGLGLDVSLNTLKNYSTKHEWQRHSSISDERNTALEETNLTTMMNERHVLRGAAMQALAMRLLETLDPAQLSVRDAVSLIRVGVDVERLAMGVATARTEVFVELVGPAIQDIVATFSTVNVIEDPEARLRAFVEKADGIIQTYFPNGSGRSLYDRN